MNVILTPTIISGPTPYAVKMDSSQVGCQNLQFVKGLKEWQTYQNTSLEKSSQNPARSIQCPQGLCMKTQYSIWNWQEILYSSIVDCKNMLSLIQTVNSTISSASSFSSSSKWSSSSSFSALGQYQSSLGTVMPWKVIASKRVKHSAIFFLGWMVLQGYFLTLIFLKAVNI